MTVKELKEALELLEDDDTILAWSEKNGCLTDCVDIEIISHGQKMVQIGFIPEM